MKVAEAITLSLASTLCRKSARNCCVFKYKTPEMSTASVGLIHCEQPPSFQWCWTTKKEQNAGNKRTRTHELAESLARRSPGLHAVAGEPPAFIGGQAKPCPGTKPKPEWNLHRHRNGQRCQHRHSGELRNPGNSAERTFLDTGLRRCHEGFCSFRLRKLIHCRLPKQALWFNLMQFSPWY